MGEVAQTLLKLLEWASSETVEHDPEWPSFCEIVPPDNNGMITWHPVVMNPPHSFEGVSLHPSLKDFYGSFWGRNIEADYLGESVLLRVAWNADDLKRIIQYVNEHIVINMPIFVANTNSDLYFGVDNTTGEVWLCEPGYPPIQKVSQSLAQFLSAILSG